MKKHIDIALLLLFLVTLTGCKDYDDTLSEQPVSPVKRSAVKTQLSISISGIPDAKTRMSDDAYLGASDGKFRGMKNIRLFPFIVDTEAEGFDEKTPVTDAAVAAETDTEEPTILLSAASANPGIEEDNTIKARTDNVTSFAQFYGDVLIPGGTNAFLFFGEPVATEQETGETDELKRMREYGSLRTNILEADNKEDIKFDLTPIFTGADIPAKAQKLADYLTAIHNATGWSDANKNKLEANVAGSSASILAMVQDLYTSERDAGNTIVTNQITSKINPDDPADESRWATADANGNLTFNDILKGYPGELGLPDGAAYIAYDKIRGVFEPIVDNATIGDVNDVNASPLHAAALSTYAYPPRLWYFANTPVAVSSLGMLSSQWDDSQDWQAYLDDNYDYANTGIGAVDEHTLSVALVNDITYGVARLDMTVEGNLNVQDFGDSEGKQTFQLDDDHEGKKFPVTGIMISGQGAVGYNFMQRSDNRTNWIVYDNQMPSGEETMYLNVSRSSASHTLLLPTTISNGPDDEESIRVAVEFLNNAADFHGNGGQLISKGCKFYLVGDLAVSEGTQPEGGGIRQVFASGHTTTVHFKVTSLENAYNAVPDLRLASLKMGLMVNLNWQKGIYNTTEIK